MAPEVGIKKLPAFHFDADPDPDPASQNDAKPCGSGLAKLDFPNRDRDEESALVSIGSK